MSSTQTPVKATTRRTSPVLLAAAASSLTETTLPPVPPTNTPLRLRQLQVIVVIALLILGALGFVQVNELRAQLDSAPNLADQYARLATIEANLVEAGNLAAIQALGRSSSNVEAPLREASGLLITAAATRPADQARLAAISAATTTYSSLLLQVAGSQQAGPLLNKADDTLAKEVLPELHRMRADLSAESTQRSWSFNSLALWVAVTISAVALLWASYELARRTHRWFNPGLIVAAITVLAMATFGSSAISEATTADSSSRGAQFTKVVTLTGGQLDLGELRRLQSRATLAKGLGANSADQQKLLLQQLKDNASLPGTKTASALDPYSRIASALGKSAWADAAQILTANATQTSTSSLISSVQSSLTKAVNAAADKPKGATGGLSGLAWLFLALSLVGAGAAFWSVGTRLKEYR